MNLAKALQLTVHESIPVEAGRRAQLAFNHCGDCNERMDIIHGQEVNGKPVRWSWGSMWALACPEHKEWIYAAYDESYVPWLSQEVVHFRTAYKLVETTIDQWHEISLLAEELAAGSIDMEYYQKYVNRYREAMHEEMESFDPAALKECMQTIKQDGKALAQKLSRAIWEPPVSWKE